MNFITHITYVNGMDWNFFDKLKRAVVFIEGDFLKIRVEGNTFIFRKGEFFTSYNYKKRLIVLNGEGFYAKDLSRTVIKNIKFKMPAPIILNSFTEHLKELTTIQDFYQ